MANELKPTKIRSYTNQIGDTDTYVIFGSLSDGILSISAEQLRYNVRIINCKNIEIPDSISKINRLSELKENSITKWSSNLSKIDTIEYCDSIHIPQTVTQISCIDNCKNLIIPISVRKLDFIYSCKNISIPDSISKICKLYDLNEISIIKWPQNLSTIDTIANCYGIQIPNTVKKITCIDNCKYINIPASVSSCYFKNMNDYEIPTSIVSLSLDNCNNIKLHTKITTIDFIGRSTTTIPSTTKIINEISGENGSLRLSVKSATPPLLNKAVYLSSDDILIVPVGAKEAYANDPKWGKFKNIREDADLGIASNQELQNKAKDTQKEQSAKNEPTAVKKETVKSGPTQDELFALDRLIDAALEDFVVTDEERKILLNKVKAIGMNQDEFTLILNSKIEKRLKEKPFDKPEEKKKGFFARLFGK